MVDNFVLMMHLMNIIINQTSIVNHKLCNITPGLVLASISTSVCVTYVSNSKFDMLQSELMK